MNQINELYNKVAADPQLQVKFKEALKVAHADGTNEAILAFAKEAGFSVTAEEAKEFLADGKTDGELSDTELDLVAGGKSDFGIYTVVGSVVSLALGCAMGSAFNAIAENDASVCADMFE